MPTAAGNSKHQCILHWFASFLAIFLLVLTAGTASAQPGGEQAPPEASSAESTADARALIELLRNDQAREALIQGLERLDARQSDSPVADAETTAIGLAGQVTTETAAEAEDMSFSRQIALLTKGIAEELVQTTGNFWNRLTRSSTVFEGLSGRELGVLLDALKNLLLVIVSTVAIFLLLRRTAVSIYGRMGNRAKGRNYARLAMIFVASALMDAFIVILAWAAGYVLTLLLFGEFGEMGLRQTLYLNAFLLVEMIKVGVRLLLSPASGTLRLVPLGDASARYLSRWLNVIVSILGYGQLLVVPIINGNLNVAAGSATSALIALAVLLIAVWLVLRNRKPVTDWMIGPTDNSRLHRSSLIFLARSWHWFALAYLLVMFVIVLVQPGNAMFAAFSGSGKIVAAILLGVIMSGFLTGAIARGISLPDGLTERLPLLERRLNAFVPRGLYMLRLFIIALVAIFTLDVIGLIDMRGWMSGQLGLRMTGIFFSVLSVLLVAFVIWLALNSWVDYRLNPRFGKVATVREHTLLTLLRNAATVAMFVITLMFVLAEIGLNIAPLLASAGVLGLAIGFGAQKMVQDIITGVFIQFENAMNVDDVVTIGSITGTVERLTIRSVSLRDLEGAFHIIPFSSVDTVTSYARGYGYYLCDMGIAYRENIEDAKQAMFDAFEELRSDFEQMSKIRGDFEWFGLNSFGDSAVVLRARIKCAPGTQWGVGRAYNAILKRIFDERGIEIPFPHRTIHFGDEKHKMLSAVAEG